MKRLLSGAALAAVAGILMGAAAKPDLGWDDRPAGPQIMAGWGGGRSTGPFDDGASFARFNGQLPDYVLGSDWKRALSPLDMTAEASQPAAEVRDARNDDPPELRQTAALTPAAYQEPPHPAPIYPSMEGGAAHGAELTAPAHPETAADTPTG